MKLSTAVVLTGFAGAALAQTDNSFLDGQQGILDDYHCAAKEEVEATLTGAGYRILLQMLDSDSQEGVLIFGKTGGDSGTDGFIALEQWNDGVHCVIASGDGLQDMR